MATNTTQPKQHLTNSAIEGREPVLYQGYQALCLAIFDRACLDIESGSYWVRCDALAWLRDGSGADLLDLADVGIRPSQYRKLIADLEATHEKRTADEEREKELAAFWKVFPRAIELYTRRAAACLLS